MNSKQKKTEVKKIRQEVERAYAEAVTRQIGSCCGNLEKTCCSTKAKDIGYSEDELNNLPADCII